MKPVLLTEQETRMPWQVSPYRILPVDKELVRPTHVTDIGILIDAIHEPVLILDGNLTIQLVNNAFVKKFKIQKKSLIGKPLYANKRENQQVKKLINRLKRLSKGGRSFREFELTYPFRRIGERTFLVNAKQIAYDSSHLPRILLSIADITQRKLIERQKDDFVGYVTHELKTPITSLLAFLQLLQGYHKTTGDKKSQFLLAKASGQLERLTNLLNSFTHVYKAQTGMLDLQKEKVDLYELVKETVEMFQYTTSSHAITIHGRTTTIIYADKERLRQVFSNLLINAIKYSPNAGSIIVRIREERKNIIVSVQDFGPGVPKEVQNRIFERFFRVNNKKEYSIKGLGLGLYIALEIIKAHKGKLWIESTEGKGAIFSFSLPIRSE